MKYEPIAKPAPLTPAERGRMGGLVGGRPRHGKYPKRMPWWEQALRDRAELEPDFPLASTIEWLREFKRRT